MSRLQSYSGVSSSEPFDADPGHKAQAGAEGSQLSITTPPFGKYSRDLPTFATDALAATLPLVCIGLIVGLLNLRDRLVDPSSYEIWQNTIIVFASIFPIAFAAIIGRLMYQIGRYKLEQGTTIGFLEQMLGSRTFGGTIMTQINLRTFNLLGLGLVTLWVFSPLGTQALLRILSTRLAEDKTPGTITYRDTMSDTGLSSIHEEAVDDNSNNKYFFSTRASTMISLLKMPDNIQTGTMDPWDNVKIPFFDNAYNNKTKETAETDWQTITSASSSEHERFSALAGVQIADVPTGNTTLSIESSYINLDCYNVSLFPARAVTEEKVHWGWGSFYWIDRDPRPAPPNANSSWQGFNESNWLLAVDHFVEHNTWTNRTWLAEHKGLDHVSSDLELVRIVDTPAVFANEPGVQVDATRLYFFARFGYTTHIMPPKGIAAYCDVRQKYVETRIRCERQEASTRQSCAAVAQRPSTKKHASELVSFLNFPAVFEKISQNLPEVGDQTRNNLVVDYLADPSVKDGSFISRFENVDNFVFSRRLSQILNTYILLSSHDYGTNRGPVMAWMGFNITTNEAESTKFVEKYQVSNLWIILSFVCCAVFLLGGIASIVFTHLSDGPELLGYASTVLRDSKFVDLPPESSRMHATDLSKMIQDYCVRYGHLHVAEQAQPLLGVGLEDETTAIKIGSEGLKD